MLIIKMEKKSESQKLKLRKLKKGLNIGGKMRNQGSKTISSCCILEVCILTLEKLSKVNPSVRDQGTTRKSLKKVKKNKECSRRLRKQVSSRSCYGNRKEVETLRHHGWEKWERRSKRVFQNPEEIWIYT